MRTMKNLALAVMTAAALALAGCGGGGGGTSSVTPPPAPAPTAYETAKAAIMTAETAEAAQAIVDGAADDVSGTELISLQAAADARAGALAMMARVDAQKMALMDAAGMIDTSDLSTQALVDAARMAIAGLRQAIADAADVDDTSMYQTMLDNAVDAVDTAQGGIDTDTRRTNQMAALSGASDTLQAALAALSGATPTQALLDAANNALDALKMAIMDGADLTDTEKAPYQHEADNAAAPIMTAQTAFNEAESEAEKAKAAMMAVTAMRLYAGIGATPLTGHTVTMADTGVLSVDPADVAPANLANQALTADKDTMVADNHGWEGMRHTAEPEGDVGTYEAVVYSNVGEPTDGAKFNDSANGGYTLNDDGQIADVTSVTDYAGLVDSSSFDQSAGTKTFDLANNREYLELTGTFNGVPGTYTCTPTAIATDRDTCGSTVAASGFTLIGGTWTFEPNDPEQRLKNVPDAIYASYGWWIHKSEDGETFTASAFVVDRGDVPDATGIDTLQGTATYMGGAAGKYSLRGDTGGMNDAGHFTARAMLEADFGDDMISGTIDMFMGADGESRNWSVELMEQGIGATGTILGDDGTGDAKMTKWTIDGTAGAAAGQWSGSLQDNGDDGVPKVGTGTFHSTYGQNGNDGRMVGAFGVTKQ